MENLYRVANVIGLDTDNTQHSIAIADALNGIHGINLFIEYCRKHRAGIDYVTKVEKLDILADRYKSIELDARLTDKYATGNKYAVALTKKVQHCMNFVEQHGCEFKNLRLTRDEHYRTLRFRALKIKHSNVKILNLKAVSYFKEHELRALNEVGSISLVIEYARTAKLVDEIARLYKNKLKQKERKALAGGTHKDVLRLANKMVRRG